MLKKDIVRRNSYPAFAAVCHSAKGLKKNTNQIQFSSFVSSDCGHKCILPYEDPSCLDCQDGNHIAPGENSG